MFTLLKLWVRRQAAAPQAPPRRLSIGGFEVSVYDHASLWASRVLDGGPYPAALHDPQEGPLPGAKGRRVVGQARIGRLYITLACADPDDSLRRLVIGRPAGVYWADWDEEFGSFRDVLDRAAGVYRLPPPAAWMFCNRRKAVRVRVDAEIPLLSPPGRGLLVDLSATGGRIATPRALTVGQVVGCRLPVAGEPSVEGEVIWAEMDGEGCVAGVRWLDVPQHVDQSIMQFVFQKQLELRRTGSGRGHR